jgi:type IV secretory pathway TraG/TraD family ATPase VirD4
MLVLAVNATIHWLTLVSQVSPNDPLSQQVLARVANPLLTSAQFLIPAAVAISGIHKMMEHRARYGVDRANTILNNHGCKVILPGISDPETADVLGKLIGRSAFTEQQLSVGADGRVSRSYSIRHDAMATPDALRQLTAGSAIVIHRDSPPAFVTLPYWFRRARYRKLVKVPYFRAAEHVPR